MHPGPRYIIFTSTIILFYFLKDAAAAAHVQPSLTNINCFALYKTISNDVG